ncbi:hypothetical protein [Lentzea jiangxiensis]|uniref:Uncharacterized protein n=1 Tax=Lentzea jiangxiensis TaxID=641025 RepID=A0A1H0X3B5_9PSEU|nr:hypothetical protein [Lentzea jiangxiensis]SDP97457.1 hypothetical protein SAMN05421507_13121 [Lentzea jiangxiensis]
MPSPGKVTWEQALNYFQDGQTVKEVPDRSTIESVNWLKWDVWGVMTDDATLPKGWDFGIHSRTHWVTYWGAGSADYEALSKPVNEFFGNTRAILGSLLDGGNPVAQSWTFDRAFGALSGAKDVLTTRADGLKKWRDATGHKDSDFQGAGASAFWKVLDDTIYKFEGLANRLNVRDGHAWNALTGAKGRFADDMTTVVDETKAGLQWAIETLNQGYQEWTAVGTPSYDSGVFGHISGRPDQFAFPATVLRLVVNSPGFQEDLEKSDSSNWSAAEHYAKSKETGLDARNPLFWDRITTAAKNVWQSHMFATLDAAATRAITGLAESYRTAATYLQPVTMPIIFNNITPPPNPPGPPPSPGPPGGPGSPGGSGPGSKDKPGGPPPPGSKGGSGPGGKDSPTGKDKPNIPNIPPPPGPNTGGPKPNVPNPNSPLKVPSGSSVGSDGVVRGKDGKPVLDSSGRQIVVPKGSRVGPDGNILDAKGKELTEKDRLQQDKPQEKTQDTEFDKFLDSLRKDSPSPVLNQYTPTPNLSLGGSSGLGSGSSGSGSSAGVNVVGPNSTSGHPGSGQQAPPAPPKTVGTEGGPPLIKNQQGGGGVPNGPGGVPFYPPTAGGMGGAGAGGQDQKGERDRTTWLSEDEETWGTDPKLPPSVLGARRRRGRAGSSAAAGGRNYGQGGSDGRLAGGANAPGHGYAEGSA